jgi:hypothetical protein
MSDSGKSTRRNQQFDFDEEVGKSLTRVHEQIEPTLVEAIEQLRWNDD